MNYKVLKDVRAIYYINICAENDFTISFVTWQKLNSDDISRLQGYAHEVYGSGLTKREFSSAFTIAVVLLMKLDITSCDKTVNSSKATTVHIKKLPLT